MEAREPFSNPLVDKAKAVTGFPLGPDDTGVGTEPGAVGPTGYNGPTAAEGVTGSTGPASADAVYELNADGNLADRPDVIFTYSGRTIQPLSPDIEDVSLDDIAHALANQCRFTGHTRKFYSVAEHSVHCTLLVPPKLRLTALLHDASEAYLADIARPVKMAAGFGDVYREAEARLEIVLAEKFGLVYPYPQEIKDADNAMLAQEIKYLMPDALARNWPVPDRDDIPRIACWEPQRAEIEFRHALRSLTAVA